MHIVTTNVGYTCVYDIIGYFSSSMYILPLVLLSTKVLILLSFILRMNAHQTYVRQYLINHTHSNRVDLYLYTFNNTIVNCNYLLLNNNI